MRSPRGAEITLANAKALSHSRNLDQGPTVYSWGSHTGESDFGCGEKNRW
jgi:hypothetical protein